MLTLCIEGEGFFTLCLDTCQYLSFDHGIHVYTELFIHINTLVSVVNCGCLVPSPCSMMKEVMCN